MGGGRKPGPECSEWAKLWPLIDEGTICRQQSPLPGPIGIDQTAPTKYGPMVEAEDSPWSGVFLAIGAPAVVRIPVPGSGGLAIELSPRGWTPPSGSTSTLFFQDLTGKRNLRLDYGYNKTTQAVEWHWNQKGTEPVFHIKNHTSVGPAEAALGRSARYFKYAGRAFVIFAAVTDLYSIVVSSRPLRRSIQVVTAWSLGGLGCSGVGAVGAGFGTAIAPGLGTAIGGFIGCLVGGFIGYKAGESAAGHLYDWSEDTVFQELTPEKEAPVTQPPNENNSDITGHPPLSDDPQHFRPYLNQL